MTMSRFNPPVDYLQAASRASLQSFELTRLNHAANLRLEIAALMDQWIQETSEALLARWMLDHHKSLQSSAMSPADVVRTMLDPPTTFCSESQPDVSEMVPAPPRFSDSHAAIKEPLSHKPPKQRQSAAG